MPEPLFKLVGLIWIMTFDVTFTRVCVPPKYGKSNGSVTVVEPWLLRLRHVLLAGGVSHWLLTFVIV